MAITIGTTGRYERGTTRQSTLAMLISDPTRGLWMRRRRIAQTQKRIVWELPYTFVTPAQMSAILSEFNTARGMAGEFTFRPPGASADITAQFVEDSLSYSRISPTKYRVRLSIEQAVVL